jgi:hypothetical protein
MKAIKKYLLALTLCFAGGAAISAAERAADRGWINDSGVDDRNLWDNESNNVPSDSAAEKDCSEAVSKAQDELDAQAAQADIRLHCASDESTEGFFNVTKIRALKQDGYGRLYLNCSFYAIYFAYILKKYLKKDNALPLADSKFNGLFILDFYFYKKFLKKFDLLNDFEEVKRRGRAVSDKKVENNVKKVSSKITVIHEDEKIKEYLDDADDYQVFIYNKRGHWVAFGIDYQTDKIYFVDSLGLFHPNNGKKYSSADKGILWQIRAGVSALKESAQGGSAKD